MCDERKIEIDRPTYEVGGARVSYEEYCEYADMFADAFCDDDDGIDYDDVY